ncbi:hypothetical protein ACQJBY_002627 [Aegilops geniculata]
MDGFRKVSFFLGWSELQIPSGPLEPAISASSSPPPPPLGITSSPNASSAPSDRPQREIGHGGNKIARQCACPPHASRGGCIKASTPLLFSPALGMTRCFLLHS